MVQKNYFSREGCIVLVKKQKYLTIMGKKYLKNDECVRVVVRCRPLDSKEKE